jgi:hypothetical protein
MAVKLRSPIRSVSEIAWSKESSTTDMNGLTLSALNEVSASNRMGARSQPIGTLELAEKEAAFFPTPAYLKPKMHASAV